MDLADRFEQKVDRFGEHHLWVGSKKADGTGKMKVDGKTVTARRVAWELAKGPLPVDVEVKSCPHVKACVRLDHLSLNGGDDSAVQRTRCPMVPARSARSDPACGSSRSEPGPTRPAPHVA